MTDLIGKAKVVADAGGTTANSLFIGSEGAITYDNGLQTIRLHDGATPGGRLVREGAYRDIATAIDISNTDNLVTVGLIQYSLLPVGAILVWSGLESEIPTGWVLCDGSNGTPDLRGRFIIGAGSGYDGLGTYLPGVTGGNDSVTTSSGGIHLHTAVTDSAGEHQHVGNTELNGLHSHTGTTAAGGTHSHTVTVAAATLTHTHGLSIDSSSTHTHPVNGTTASDGDHTHTAQANPGGQADDTIWLDTNPAGNLRAYWPTGSAGLPIYNPATNPLAINVASAIHDHSTNTRGAHTHTFSVTSGTSGVHSHTGTVNPSDGGAGTSTSHSHGTTVSTASDHTHAITADPSGEHLHDFVTSFEAAHVHNISATSVHAGHTHDISDVKPPYYALCWIKFVGT